MGRPAAFVFQPLGVLPLPIAAVLFSFLNLAPWVVAIVLTRDIVAHTFELTMLLLFLASVALAGRESAPGSTVHRAHADPARDGLPAPEKRLA